MERPFKFKLGVNVKDIVTGIEGVITGEARYLTGCDQFVVQPPMKEDGTVPDARWFDSNRLTQVGTTQLVIPDEISEDTAAAPKRGGPVANPAPIK